MSRGSATQLHQQLQASFSDQQKTSGNHVRALEQVSETCDTMRGKWKASPLHALFIVALSLAFFADVFPDMLIRGKMAPGFLPFGHCVLTAGWESAQVPASQRCCSS